MKLKAVIDPGHSPGNTNKGYSAYYEHKGMWLLSNYLKEALIRCGWDVCLTRTENEDPTLAARGKRAADYGANLFISEHSNAANGAARGVEVFYSVARTCDKPLAALMSKSIADFMNSIDRGAKIRESTNVKGKDYYSVMYSAEVGGVPHILLIENGFHDNAQDEAFLLKESNLKAIAEVQARICCEFFGVSYKSAGAVQASGAGTPILNSPSANVAQAKAWAASKGAADFFVGLADIFWRVAQVTGVDPAVVYAQSAKETGYGRFGGVLDQSFCNPCGMKTTEGGSDSDKAAHKRFSSWDEGVLAQVDHIALYAGAGGYPKGTTPDPRHFSYLLGKCKTVESLEGNWAPSATYGTEIVRMMEEIKKMAVSEANIAQIPKWQSDGLKALVDSKIIEDENYWRARFSQNITVAEFIGLLGKAIKCIS